MKRASMLIAALVPFAVAANQDVATADWDYEQLRGNWRVSEIIGSEVQSRDGQSVGEVREVLLATDGSVASVLINAEDAGLDDGAATSRAEEERVTFEDDDVNAEREDDLRRADADPRATGGIADDDLDATDEDARVGTVADTDRDGDAAEERHDPTTRDNTNYMARDDIGRMGPEGARAETVAVAGEDGVIALDWSSPTFEDGRMVLDVDRNALQQRVSYEDDPAENRQDHIRASELIGMDVNLSDEDSFAEIEDILISPEGRSTAFVLESWNFLTRDRFAIPVDLQSVNMEESVLDYQLTSGDVKGFGEFDFDEYSDAT